MSEFVILDFGSQSTHLIRRRLQDLGFSAEVIPSSSALDEVAAKRPAGIIFSGSPNSVYDDQAQRLSADILKLDVPKLGICYGFQRMVQDSGGRVEPCAVREFGECAVSLVAEDPLFQSIEKEFTTWMSHGDSITALPDDCTLIAASENHPAAAYMGKYRFWGVQFHPELSHCNHGIDILRNFAQVICAQQSSLKSLAETFEHIKEDIRKKTQNRPVLLLISGGVDSSVAAAALLKSLSEDQVHLLYLDTGLMRRNETKEIESILRSLAAKHVHIVYARQEYLSALANIADPEEKRKIIGDLFVKITQREVEKLGLGDNFLLAQGTLYTDLIESGKGTGKHAHVIKSHHNVNSPLITQKREQGQLIEPLRDLYKDQARALGKYLGLPDSIIYRHPFPGPGLGIRVLGAVDKEKIDILQRADAIYLEELRKRDLYDKIWQAFAVLIPVKSVGVAGDVRRYGYIIALRAVSSDDGMSAEAFNFNLRDIKEIAARITNEIAEVSRVVYDISSKPPATVEWE